MVESMYYMEENVTIGRRRGCCEIPLKDHLFRKLIDTNFPHLFNKGVDFRSSFVCFFPQLSFGFIYIFFNPFPIHFNIASVICNLKKKYTLLIKDSRNLLFLTMVHRLYTRLAWIGTHNSNGVILLWKIMLPIENYLFCTISNDKSILLNAN